MKRLAILILFASLLTGRVYAQDATVDSDGGDTASLSTQSQDSGHWEDQGWWYRDEDSWAWEEYWVWVPDPADKTVEINDEWVYIAANNQCTQSNPCVAWGPATVWGAHPGAVITGDFVLYKSDPEGGPITWQIRGDGGMHWLVPNGTSCGRCRWQLDAAIENPGVWIVWWGSSQSFKVAMENITIDYNPAPPPKPAYSQEVKDAAAASAARARGYAGGMDAFSLKYGGKLNGWIAAALFVGSQLENRYAEHEDKIAGDPIEACTGWNVQPSGVDGLWTGDPTIDAVVQQASYYFGWLDAAYHFANQYGSGCGDWALDNALWSLRNAGAAMHWNGIGTMIGSTLRYNYGDLYDPDGWACTESCSNTLPTAADYFDAAGNDVQGVGDFYQNQ